MTNIFYIILYIFFYKATYYTCLNSQQCHGNNLWNNPVRSESWTPLLYFRCCQCHGYYLGYGLRKQNDKLQYYCLLKMGFNKFKYPFVHDLNNSEFEISFKDVSSLSFNVSVGVEYYFLKNFALTAWACVPDHSPPELIYHVPPTVNNCYHLDYIFELKTCRKRPRLPAYANTLKL